MSQVVKKQKIEEHSFDYDYIVIGGGSGGMASAKEAARLGAKVCLFDYVKPSTQGSKWGLGGTCVNVGCVPKKIMHYAGLLGAGLHDAETLGWNISGTHEHNWEKLRSTVQSYIKSLNFGYRNGLRSAQVNYINGLASFSGPNTVTYPDKNGQPITVSGARFLIAVGGRPHIPEDVPGAREHSITSDDIFSLKTSPGKTLVVGGSYIALECAGFLTELGYDTTVAVRSIPLRGFDRQCSEKIASLMADTGTKFRYGVTPTLIERVSETEIKVAFSDGTSDTYNTVLYATGRRADTSGLNLDLVNVHLNKEGKIICRNEKTTGEHIYAVGDAVEGVPELTPAAIRAGELLARRLFGDSTEFINYNEIATTVFTPFEYGCVGLSEEAAEEQYGKDNIETFLFEFSTLELSAVHRHKVASRRADEFDENLPPPCLSKLVCLKTENLRVVGFHFVGPNAGEITQGFSLALLMGATKSHFDRLVGIHPTDAESFTSLSITRSSGESFVATGGCGGGKCG